MPAGLKTETAASVIVAGVGYPFLRDGALGPVLSQQLAQRPWPLRVTVADYGFSAIDALHWLQEGRFQRGIFFGSVVRGNAPGTIRRYRWPGPPPAHEVQQYVAEAAQAVISLEGMLAVCGYFGALPPETIVYEVEPLDLGHGEGFTEPVAQAADRLIRRIRKEAMAE